MCILFIYAGADDDDDYSLILASNRDEYYDRPSQEMMPWAEDPEVLGGRDLQPGSGEGTWLAMSPSRRKIGVLLNLPEKILEDAQSRGKLVACYIKSDKPVEEYIDSIKNYTEQCNGFVLVTVEFSKADEEYYPKVRTYSNASDQLLTHTDKYLGFGNNLPENPLKKVKAGKHKLMDICSKYRKCENKKQLLEELLLLLKSEERHLPDHQLEKRLPIGHEYLSSIFVQAPEKKYGTRTHTIILVTKEGHVDVMETTSERSSDSTHWKTTEYKCNMA